jgi:hypothetical protein
MNEAGRKKFTRELAVVLVTFAVTVAVIPPVVAAVGYQSGQAMFWPALAALYTYFLPYTLGACVVVTALTLAVRAVVASRKKTVKQNVSTDGRD